MDFFREGFLRGVRGVRWGLCCSQKIFDFCERPHTPAARNRPCRFRGLYRKNLPASGFAFGRSIFVWFFIDPSRGFRLALTRFLPSRPAVHRLPRLAASGKPTRTQSSCGIIYIENHKRKSAGTPFSDAHPNSAKTFPAQNDAKSADMRRRFGTLRENRRRRRQHWRKPSRFSTRGEPSRGEHRARWCVAPATRLRSPLEK